MTFANPIGLLGLLSLPVILALHFISERKRRYTVSHLGLWSFLDQEMRGPRARRIPITWLLLLDLLIGALLSLAWSQPQIVFASQAQRARNLVILLDDSSSMLAQDGTQSRLDKAKSEAEGLLERLSPQDVAIVITFGQRASLVADSRRDGLAQVSAKIRELKAGETGHAVREALALGQASLDPDLPAEIHILTDGSFPLDRGPGPLDAGLAVEWHYFGGLVDNQAITALNAVMVAAGRIQVFARIANFGSQGVSRNAVLEINSRRVAETTIILPPNSRVVRVWQASLSPTAAPSEIKVSLQGVDPLAADDTAVVGLQSIGNVRVALVGEDPAPLQQALQVIPGVALQLFSPQEYASMGGKAAFDLTIFRKTLPSAWPDGAVLVVEPPEGASQPGSPVPSLAADSTVDVPADAALQIPNSNPLVEGIDFSGIRWSRVWRLAQGEAGLVPLLAAGQTPLLLWGPAGADKGARGRLVVLLADLNSGNFTRHPAFPIFIANLVEIARQGPILAGIKTGEAIQLPGAGRAVEIQTPDLETQAFKDEWPDEWRQTLDPGSYRIALTGANGEKQQFITGVNAGDALESDLRLRDWAQPGQLASTDLGSLVQNTPPDLKPWLLAAALLALVGEAVLSWRR